MKNIFKLIIVLVICQLAGLLGSMFNAVSLKDWYPSLIKPSFNPPNWIFAPVWIILFVLMGISLYLAWIGKSKNKKYALKLFYTQLMLNIIWSAFFFGLRNPLLAFIEIIILCVFILLTMLEFYKIDSKAGYLLIPYLAWVTFASVLNLFIFILNH